MLFTVLLLTLIRIVWRSVDHARAATHDAAQAARLGTCSHSARGAPSLFSAAAQPPGRPALTLVQCSDGPPPVLPLPPLSAHINESAWDALPLATQSVLLNAAYAAMHGCALARRPRTHPRPRTPEASRLRCKININK